MKQTILPLTICAFLYACNKEHNTPLSALAAPQSTTYAPFTTPNEAQISITTSAASFINLHDANILIESYLESILLENPTQIKSFLLDAASLRTLLDNTTIERIKIHLAHTESIVNSSQINLYQGLKEGAITLILSGVDASGNYVFHNDSLAVNRSLGCPPSCISSGTAVNDYLVIE